MYVKDPFNGEWVLGDPWVKNPATGQWVAVDAYVLDAGAWVQVH
jgi:hypothetical protein